MRTVSPISKNRLSISISTRWTGSRCCAVRKGIVNLNLWSRNITNTDYQAFYFESFNQSFIQKGKPFQIGGEITVTF